MTRALDEVQAQLGTEKQDHACCALKIMLRLEILQNAGEKTGFKMHERSIQRTRFLFI